MKKRAERQPPPPPSPNVPRPYLTIPKECFENYFWLDGPGRNIVIDALSEGVINTSYEAVDLLCVANQMFERNVHAGIMLEMARRGRTIDYRKAETSEQIARLTTEAVDCLGHDSLAEILRLAEENVRMVLRVSKSDAQWLPSALTTPAN